ncbi:STIP1 y and U box-containing protein 1 [Entomortierella chlamydospora]|uniref:RING-type E3 ubiquitin transferase n=1 Tax=Entomortierella chlamydospora TaxID=101097 RepID=A0A9P6MTF7_9FUNG|nr:STIP1 y and U box-containing protein 1 [Entomortierella chlamydospora]
MTSYLTAEQHKLKGNEYFKNKAYDDAIQEYSTAIVKDPKVAVYYCNRANCFLKLERFTNVVADCERVVELDPKSVKGYYFMGKAQLELGQPSEAYSRLKKSLDQRSSFIKDIVMIISEAKKQKWIEDERRKLSQVSETYHYLSGLVEQDIQRQLEALDKNASDYQENIAYLRSERDQRLQQLEILLQRAGTPDQYVKPHIQLDQSKAPLISPESSPQLPKVSGKQDSHQEASFQVREVPDYFLDKITFEFMHDPVISTKSGISYERSTLLEHFSYGRMFDPVAQVPLTEHDIVPNRALKEACDDFLSKNGWAVDY